MSKFHVGQKVVCISATKNLVKGNEYEIMEIEKCRTCGEVGVFVGISDNNLLPLSCHNGHLILNETYKIHHLESRFAPIEEYSDSKDIAKSLVKELQKVDIQKIKTPELV